MKFSIRDLMWLTVVVALSLGWWLHSEREARKAELREEIHWENFKFMGAHRDANEYVIDADGRLSIPPPNSPAPAPNPPNPKTP